MKNWKVYLSALIAAALAANTVLRVIPAPVVNEVIGLATALGLGWLIPAPGQKEE